jgi:hypothetical protein
MIVQDRRETHRAMRLRILQFAALTAVLFGGSVLPSAAQPPVQYGGRVAVAGAFGGAIPTAEHLDNGTYAGGTFLLSLASHVGASVEAGGDDVAIDRPGFRSDLMPRFANLNIVFSLRSGPFKPYLSGGVGVYRHTFDLSREALTDPSLRATLLALGLTPSTTGSIRVRHDEPGINLGGGFEYFFARRSALLMDLRAHATRDFVEVAPFGGVFVNAAVGFRQYF